MARDNDKRGNRRDKPKKEFDEVLLEVRRVTRVTTGGRQLSFRAIILIGNGKGKIGLGVAKGADVSIAVRKATHEAYKQVVQAPINEQQTIPYEITHKYKAARIKLIPAAPGTGLKAGSSVRRVLELAGYTNILSKIMGTNNKLNNAIAAVQALSQFKEGKSPKKKAPAKAAKETKKTETATATKEAPKTATATKEDPKAKATKAPKTAKATKDETTTEEKA